MDFIYKIAHIYLNHLEQVNEQLSREPRDFPKLVINPEKKSIFDIELSDLTMEGYNPHPTIKAPVAV
ncbi:Thymidylate synthase OS=Ureibacillus acetophenoni OX=614649 GN=thyA PE=3 SV=1 [Ureibacillus acetophenoni]